MTVTLEGRIGREVKRLASVREIVRGPDGSPTGLRPLSLPGVKAKPALDLSGPVVEMLPPRQPSRVDRLVAQVALERMGLPGAGPKKPGDD